MSQHPKTVQPVAPWIAEIQEHNTRAGRPSQHVPLPKPFPIPTPAPDVQAVLVLPPTEQLEHRNELRERGLVGSALSLVWRCLGWREEAQR